LCDKLGGMSPGPKPRHTDYVTLRIEPEVRKLVEELAAEEERTMSQMTRILLREALEGRKAKKEAAGKKKGR
jgi:hypothetical protein